MEGVEGVDSAHAARTEEVDSEAIKAAVSPVLATEFTAAACVRPPAFVSYEFIKEFVTVRPP